MIFHFWTYSQHHSICKWAQIAFPEDHDALPLYHAGQILFFKGQHEDAARYLEKASVEKGAKVESRHVSTLAR